MYDYLKKIKEDIKEYYDEKYLKETDKETLFEEMWIDDSITGNASGSYTFSTYEAEENIAHNMDLLKEAILAFNGNFQEALERGAEYCDVTIRCYLLDQAIEEVKKEF